jgi:hypothetical protein
LSVKKRFSRLFTVFVFGLSSLETAAGSRQFLQEIITGGERNEMGERGKTTSTIHEKAKSTTTM